MPWTSWMELVLYFYIIKIQESQGEIHVIQMNKYEAQACVALQGLSFVSFSSSTRQGVSGGELENGST